MNAEQWIADLMAWLKLMDASAPARLDSEIARRERELAVLRAVRVAIVGADGRTPSAPIRPAAPSPDVRHEPPPEQPPAAASSSSPSPPDNGKPAAEGPAGRPKRAAVAAAGGAAAAPAQRRPKRKPYPPEALDGACKRIAAAIKRGGPSLGEKLRLAASASGGGEEEISHSKFYDALKSDWFEREADGYHLTAAGEAALAADRDPSPSE